MLRTLLLMISSAILMSALPPSSSDHHVSFAPQDYIGDELFKASQEHQTPLGSQAKVGSVRVPITKNLTHQLGYFAEICFGFPRQCGQLLIDISAPDSYVDSVECGCSKSRSAAFGYNATASSTHQDDGSHATIDYRKWKAQGIISRDDVYMNDLSVPGVTFLEALRLDGPGPSWDDMSIVHGVLGLAPSSQGSSLNASNPFLEAATQKLLNENKFGLRLEDPGELNIGGVNPRLFLGNFTYVPLTKATEDGILPASWKTSIASMAIGLSDELSFSFSGHTAEFTTMWPYMYIPDEIVMKMIEVLGFNQNEFLLPPFIDCQLRGELPYITLNLAGHDFVLSGYDYTIEWDLGHANSVCVSAFQPIGLESNEIILGSAFLRAHYSVFDLDNQRIGFAKLS